MTDSRNRDPEDYPNRSGGKRRIELWLAALGAAVVLVLGAVSYWGLTHPLRSPLSPTAEAPDGPPAKR